MLDEVADMDPIIWGEIVRPALGVRNGWVLFIGTPKGINLFSELYYRAQTEDGWHSEIRRASETGVLTKEELEKQKREMTDAQYAQEMDCDFSASSDDVLLKLEDVLAAQKRTVQQGAYDFAGKALGVDCARFGGDKTVLTLRQGLVCFEPVALGQMDTMATAARIALAIDKSNPDSVFIDNGTFGAGIVDRLRQLRYDVVAVDFGSKPSLPKFENKRTEMWWDAAEWTKGGGCLPNVQELARDLTGPKYDYRNLHGRIQLESKDDMKARGLKSPDYGDSFALTFAFPVASATLSLLQGKQAHAVTDYDPYATPDKRVETEYQPLNGGL